MWPGTEYELMHWYFWRKDLQMLSVGCRSQSSSVFNPVRRDAFKDQKSKSKYGSHILFSLNCNPRSNCCCVASHGSEDLAQYGEKVQLRLFQGSVELAGSRCC